MKLPKYSFLMSVYAKEKPEFLKQAIDSMLTQSYPPDEILIVKDGPLTKELDQCLECYLTEHAGIIKTIQTEKQRGLGLALQVGVEKCRNELIARMDSDDICTEDRIEKQLTYLAGHPELSILGCGIAEFYKDPSETHAIRSVPVGHRDIVKMSRFRNPMNHVTVVFRKSAVIDAGNYRDMPGFEDYLLWLNMLKHGCLFANLPEELVVVRTNENFWVRRSGRHYFRMELNFISALSRERLLAIPVLILFGISRLFVRLVPIWILKMIYIDILRKHKIQL